MSESLAYIAGPLFTEAERSYLEQVDERVRANGWKTYLPHRDGGLQDHRNGEALFLADQQWLNRARLVVAWLDGADVDSGTAWEIGYAFARGILIVGLRTDSRVCEPWSKVNLMIEMSVSSVKTLADLGTEVARVRSRWG